MSRAMKNLAALTTMAFAFGPTEYSSDEFHGSPQKGSGRRMFVTPKSPQTKANRTKSKLARKARRINRKNQ